MNSRYTYIKHEFTIVFLYSMQYEKDVQHLSREKTLAKQTFKRQRERVKSTVQDIKLTLETIGVDSKHLELVEKINALADELCSIKLPRNNR